MDFPQLRLWQESALQPENAGPDVWITRQKGQSGTAGARSEELRRSLERSREASRRTRATALYGLALSVLFGLPTGFVFTYSTLVASGPGAAQCIQVSSMLDGALQRGLSQYRSLKGLTPSEEALLSAEVCDPLLKSVIPSLVAGITSDIDVREMGEAVQAQSGRPAGWSMLRAVVGAGAQ